MPPSSDTQRYLRQTVLAELGIEGQQRLRQASLLYVGAGALGSAALPYLVAAGIGHIGIIDDDHVELTNLHRQVLYREQDQGQAKATIARAHLKKLNSDCVIEALPQRFSVSNAQQLLTNYSLILDGTDNFSTKFLLNDACVRFNKPLIYAAILGFDAQVTVFDARFGPCYRCLYPKAPSQGVPNCAQAGVLGAVAAMAGSMQALEAIKNLLGDEWCTQHQLHTLLGKLWLFDAKSLKTRLLKITKNPNCPACSLPPQHIDLAQHRATSEPIAEINAPAALTQLGQALFIDVRDPFEWKSGIIPGAYTYPLTQLLNQNLPTTLTSLPKNHTLIIYCQHGIRSLTAAHFLKTQGFSQVMHLKGGVVQWTGALSPYTQKISDF